MTIEIANALFFIMFGLIMWGVINWANEDIKRIAKKDMEDDWRKKKGDEIFHFKPLTPKDCTNAALYKE